MIYDPYLLFRNIESVSTLDTLSSSKKKKSKLVSIFKCISFHYTIRGSIIKVLRIKDFKGFYHRSQIFRFFKREPFRDAIMDI